ncbi:hypothetical protein [Streptomyces sp. NBC_00996]|uniref:hypothetical protein n=1 Tax=Streptomyces sp. NBC_00996 TaxID=2903710 RepID=UPI00386A6B6A|nr:hypothetical protein OG390_22100 [Streptomyces sp. NBC_00996]
MMLQEAGPWPAESAMQQDDLTRTTVDRHGTVHTHTIRQFLWSVRDGDFRTVYFAHTQNGQGGRVNLAIVCDGEPDEVNVVQNPVDAGRIALGVRYGHYWYFTVHGLSGGGGDSAALLDAIDTAVEDWQPPGEEYSWTAGGDFNVDPDILEERSAFPVAMPVSTPSNVPTHDSGNRYDYFVTDDIPASRESAYLVGMYQPPSDHRVVGLGRMRAAGEPPSEITLLPLGDDLKGWAAATNPAPATRSKRIWGR